MSKDKVLGQYKKAREKMKEMNVVITCNTNEVEGCKKEAINFIKSMKQAFGTEKEEIKHSTTILDAETGKFIKVISRP